MALEPEVNEWTEAAGVQGAETENESEYANNEGYDVLAAVVFREVDLVLNFQAELR